MNNEVSRGDLQSSSLENIFLQVHEKTASDVQLCWFKKNLPFYKGKFTVMYELFYTDFLRLLPYNFLIIAAYCSSKTRWHESLLVCENMLISKLMNQLLYIEMLKTGREKNAEYGNFSWLELFVLFFYRIQGLREGIDNFSLCTSPKWNIETEIKTPHWELKKNKYIPV